MCLSGSLSSPVLARDFSERYGNGRGSSLGFLLVWIKVKWRTGIKEMLFMMSVTYKWTPVMSWNKFRELFLSSALIRQHRGNIRGETPERAQQDVWTPKLPHTGISWQWWVILSFLPALDPVWIGMQCSHTENKCFLKESRKKTKTPLYF